MHPSEWVDGSVIWGVACYIWAAYLRTISSSFTERVIFDFIRFLFIFVGYGVVILGLFSSYIATRTYSMQSCHEPIYFR